MKVIVYRIMPAGMSVPTKEWHDQAKLHIEPGCALRHLRTRSHLIRQTFDTRDTYDCRWCAFCSSQFRGDYDTSKNCTQAERNEMLRRQTPKWKAAFTADHTKIADGDAVFLSNTPQLVRI